MALAAVKEFLFPDYLAEVRRYLEIQAAQAAHGQGKDGLPQKKLTLLDKLGGKEAVDAAVSMFYGKLVADPRISEFFQNIDIKSQKTKMTSFLMFLFSAGATTYRGKGMYAAHKELALQEEHFQAVVECFVQTMQAMRVPPSITNEAVAALQTNKKKILGLEDDNGKPVVKPPSILQRMGGRDALDGVIEIYFGKLLGDPVLSGYFANTQMSNLRRKYGDMLEVVLDGKRWTGPSMYDTHKNLGITDENFDAMAGHMIASLKVFRVPQDIIDDIMKVVGGMRGQVMGKVDARGKPAGPPATVYGKLGGADGVASLVDIAGARLMSDPRISEVVAMANPVTLRSKQIANLTLLLDKGELPACYTQLDDVQIMAITDIMGAAMKIMRTDPGVAGEVLELMGAAPGACIGLD